MTDDSITLSDRTFYVSIRSEGLTIHPQRENAVANLERELQADTEAQIVELRYTENGNDQARFQIEPLGWRELALELAGVDEPKQDGSGQEDQ